MNKKICGFLLITFLIIIQGCTNNNYKETEQQLKKLDPCYGILNDKKLETCKAQVKGKVDKEGEGGLFDKMLTDLLNERNIGSGTGGATSSVNKWLWNGSIETLEDFPLKIADAFGGVIETDWLIKEGVPNERCSIKVLIKSSELISNGIKANMICQKLEGTNWVLRNHDLSEANEAIENSILRLARKSYLSFAN
jgi:hypothetical protein